MSRNYDETEVVFESGLWLFRVIIQNSFGFSISICELIYFNKEPMASRSNLIQHQHVFYRPGGYEQPRTTPQHQFENTPIPYSQSYTKNPIPQMPHCDPRRSFPTITFTNHSERTPTQAYKSADSVHLHDFRHPNPQPNVVVQINTDLEKSKLVRSRNINQLENPHPQQVQIVYGQRQNKPHQDLIMAKGPAESPQIVQPDRRVPVQPTKAFFLKGASGTPLIKAVETPHPTAAIHLFESRTDPALVRPRNATDGKDSSHPPITAPFFSSRPFSSAADNKITVKFEYQQTQAPNSDRVSKLQQLKNLNYSQMVSRQQSDVKDMPDRSGYTERQVISKAPTPEPTELGSRARLKESVYLKTEEAQFYQQHKIESFDSRGSPKRRVVTLEEISSNQMSSSIIGSTEEENHSPFKKNKANVFEPCSKYDEIRLTSPVYKDCQLKEVRFIPPVKNTKEIQENLEKNKPSLLIQSYCNTTASSGVFTGHSILYSASEPAEFKKVVISPTKSNPSPRKSTKKGPKLQDFEVGRKLGKGKYGDVYMVQHKLTGFICAMKTIQKKLIEQQNVSHQFIRQIKLQSFLRHQNIAQLYGYFDDPDKVYLLLELCSDGYLTSMLRDRKRLPQAETASIVSQICNGVDFMHRHRIIHRDLKPQNILMHNGSVKICDFGWAVDISDGLRNTFCGTPLYVSPDVLRGDMYDQKIDLWGIGVLTYELLVGKVPFKIITQNDLQKILKDNITFPEYCKISDTAKDFIIKLTHKDPKQRMEMDDVKNHPFLREHERSSQSMKKIFASLNNFI